MTLLFQQKYQKEAILAGRRQSLCNSSPLVYDRYHRDALMPEQKALTCTNAVGEAMTKDPIQMKMVTNLACFIVQNDRACRGYMIATNL